MSRPAKRPEQAALFGDNLPEAPTSLYINDRLEAEVLTEVLTEVLQMIQNHPAVAWVEHQVSSVARIGSSL